MTKIILLSGFNNSKYASRNEKKAISHLKEKGYDVKKIDYYKYYNNSSSSKLISETAKEVIEEYYDNNCEPLTIVAWSLGGCITTEVLNIIDSLNSQLEEKDKIRINKVILFSPAWFILKSQKSEYKEPEEKRMNKIIGKRSIPFFISHPGAFYHLFNISKYSKRSRNEDDGLNIFKKYNTTCILPNNDQYINVEKTKDILKRNGIDIFEVGNYGHLAILLPSIIDSVIDKVKQKEKRKD